MKAIVISNNNDVDSLKSTRYEESSTKSYDVV